MRYDINKPKAELTEGYFTLAIKYISLFIAGWIGGWIFLLVILNYRKRKSSVDLSHYLMQFPGTTSAVIVVGILLLFGKRIFTKYKRGLITSIEFSDNKLNLVLLNTINGKERTKEIDYDKLSVSMQSHHNGLFGLQRKISIFEQNNLINQLNIDMTAWCRHQDIEKIITNLTTFRRYTIQKKL